MNPQQALDALAPTATDAEIVTAISRHLFACHFPGVPPRYRFAVRFDAREQPCPLHADKVDYTGKLCIIERGDVGFCEKWVSAALGFGLTVVRLGYSNRDAVYCGSVADVRKRIERKDNDNEEIPF